MTTNYVAVLKNKHGYPYIIVRYKNIEVKTPLRYEYRVDGEYLSPPLSHADYDLVSAHLVDLGLTGYGETPDEARAAVESTFKHWAGLGDEMGSLHRQLDLMGVDWEEKG